jgi:hypothetical protein
LEISKKKKEKVVADHLGGSDKNRACLIKILGIIWVFFKRIVSLCLEFSVNDRYVHIKNISPPSLNDAAAHVGNGITR